MEINFNKIYVAESLTPDDCKTGQRLHDDLLQIKAYQDGRYSSEIKIISSKKELFRLLEDIAAEAKMNGIRPIIHLECHANQEGLQLSNGDFISWEKLRRILTEININAHNNVLFVLAACEGANVGKLLVPTLRAPFTGFMGPQKRISGGEIEGDYKMFYDELLTSFNLDKASEKLEHNKYMIAGCDKIFEMVFQGYFNDYCNDQAIKNRIDRIIIEVLNWPNVNISTIPKMRDQLKSHFLDVNAAVDHLKKSYFMLDLFPEDSARFSVRYPKTRL